MRGSRYVFVTTHHPESLRDLGEDLPAWSITRRSNALFRSRGHDIARRAISAWSLENTEPAIDLVLNPAFTPVTADFDAAHFEARRSLYACSVFCNFARFGGSRIETPEKHAAVSVPARDERVEVVDVPLLAMREARSAWDERARRRFIQSTRR